MNLQTEHCPKEIPTNFNGQIFSTKKTPETRQKGFLYMWTEVVIFPRDIINQCFPVNFCSLSAFQWSVTVTDVAKFSFNQPTQYKTSKTLGSDTNSFLTPPPFGQGQPSVCPGSFYGFSCMCVGVRKRILNWLAE